MPIKTPNQGKCEEEYKYKNGRTFGEFYIFRYTRTQFEIEIAKSREKNDKSRARDWNQDLKQENELGARFIYLSAYQFKPNDVLQYY